MEYGLLPCDDPDTGPLDLYVLNMIAIGNYYKDSGAAPAKDLKSDIENKWKQDEIEYQLRKANAA